VTSYRFVEHGGEVELALEAATETGLFEAAARALAELVADTDEGAAARHEIELRGDDRALLLVDWLNELVFLAEVEQFVPERVTGFERVGDRLRVAVAGRRGRPRHLVKAVTLSELDCGETGGMWHGHVVLDV
jgi:SHS2 domain-containing protein